jgi:hypothetical protein
MISNKIDLAKVQYIQQKYQAKVFQEQNTNI